MKSVEVVIIGGGLAGLVAGIHLLSCGIRVCVIEKDAYPRHRVCGEYLSNEVLPYLEHLGVELNDATVPNLKRMQFSTRGGDSLDCTLDLGGIGVSRYTLDDKLYQRYLAAGGEFIMATVNGFTFDNNKFNVNIKDHDDVEAHFVLGAFGKRSNMDKYMGRQFFQKKSSWMAVKAHYTNKNFPEDLVALHNFKGGYCGLSYNDLGSVNVCYLATYESFQRYKNTKDFELNNLSTNPLLEEFFQNAKMIFEKPLSIAQISFDKKDLVQDHVLMLGDAGGLIHPLSGNGMAMAIQSAKLASEALLKYRVCAYDRALIENYYKILWNNEFNRRMKTGRLLQKVLMHDRLSHYSQRFVQRIPGLLPKIIQLTHGNPIHV